MRFNFTKKTVLSILIVWFAIVTITAQQPKYVFYCIGDGMGMNHVEATQFFLSKNIGDVQNRLLFTQFPEAGFATTYSASNYITCSAAAGTALATGVKTVNKTLGVDPDQKNVYSLIVDAQKKGFKTAVITSMSIDDATPSAFYAHQKSRNNYYEIAIQGAESGIDFLGGAGLKMPASKTNPSAINAFDYFVDKGYTVIKGDKYVSTSTAKKILMISEKNYRGIELPYAIDREKDDMQLKHLTTAALDFLQRDKSAGFFMMMEGGQIDHCAHVNDGASVIQEVIDFDNNVRLAYEFYKKHPEETLIVVTADHETGGLALGAKHTILDLQLLGNQKVSIDKLSTRIRKLRDNKDHKATWEEVAALLKTDLGFWDTVKITPEDQKRLKEYYDITFSGEGVKAIKTLYANSDPLAVLAIEIMNKTAMVGWTTNSHTAAAVPVYAIGVGAENFSGRMDNTDIQKRIKKLLQ